VHHAFCEKTRDPHCPRLRGLVGSFAWFGKENKYVDLDHVPPHLEGMLLLLIDTYSFVPTLIELALAFHCFGVSGLYISYVAGALCKAGALWFNVTNHPPEHPLDSRGCGAVDDVHKGAMKAPNIFFAMIQEITWPITFLIGEAAHDHHHVHPALAHRPGGVDLPYYCFIRPLEACGLVWHVKHMRAQHKWEPGTKRGSEGHGKNGGAHPD
jgi:fatty-acid desaturase